MESKNQDRKNEFIDAAEKLFKENGIVDTTISSIVKELDVAKGLFYYYFQSKDDVIEAISQKYTEVFDAMLKQGLNHLSYEERLHQYLKNAIDSFDQLHHQLQTSDSANIDALRNQSLHEAKNNAIDMLETLLIEGKQKEKFMFEHERYYAQILICGMMELVEDGQASKEEIEQIIYDLIERAGQDA